MEFNVGQKVLVEHPDYRGKKLEPTEAIISKVGNKYFFLEGFGKIKFEIETGEEVSEYAYTKRVYLSLDEIKRKNEHKEVFLLLKNKFSNMSNNDYSLEQLLEVKKILEL